MFRKVMKGAVATLVAAAGWVGVPAAFGQGGDVPTTLPAVTGEGGVTAPPVLVPMEGPQATLSGLPVTAGCSSCGTDCMNGPVGCGEGGCGSGREACNTLCGYGPFTKAYAAFYNALCCPDPCYVPQWRCAANAALFVDHARTATVTRIRWDAGLNMVDPDRAGYFWQRIGGGGPNVNPARLDYHELRIYQEAGVDKFSFFIDMGFRSLSPEGTGGGTGGFGDLRLGTKSMILDSDALQFTFQFATTLPTAAAGKGLGIGEVALDPSLITAVKLRENTYYQGQIGYWFGVARTAGSVLHYHNSINQVLWQPAPGNTLVGTFEGVGYSFLSGSVTTPGGRVDANNTTYYTLGPGLRWCVCDKLDVGFGMQFAVTDRAFAQQLYRTEIRFRF